MKNYVSRTRNIGGNDPVFFLPPYKVEQVFVSLAQTVDWGVELLGVPNFWKYTKGKGVNVAVLDTGIAEKHPDLEHVILDAHDFTGSRSGIADVKGHGTHCVGILAARDNQQGVVGVAPECKVLVGKVLGDNGTGSFSNIIDGIHWAVESGAHIISMSLGSNSHSPELQAAIEDAMKKGVFVICAAGNDGPRMDSVDYPGAYDKVITVGSIDRRLKISKFSSRGKPVDIVAPGDRITSTFPPDTLVTMSGTSMATPFVAGVAALVLSKHRQFGGETPIKTQEDMLAHLIESAIDLGETGFDPAYGFGLINPNGLVLSGKQPNSSTTLQLQL